MRLLGALYLTTAAAIWGGVYVVSKFVLDYVPPLTLLTVRLLIAGVILGAITVYQRQWRAERRHQPLLWSLGLIGFTASLALQFFGTKLSSAHNGGLITSASPAFIVLFAVWVLKERQSWVQWVALGLATVGVLAVVGPETQSAAAGSTVWLGNLCLIGASVTWGLYTVLSKLACRYYSSLTVTTYATLTGLVFTTPLALATERHAVVWSSLPASVWWGIAYVGIISTAVAFYLWVRGFALIDAGTGSLFFFAQPLVAAVLGALVLGETLRWYFFLGAGFIFAGLVVSALGARSDGSP
ncbi:MAG TPA: DMT family transporter [Symbiobacteriaceae bacterium]|jgi:drug/metabolite transporter (DMT)-like permease